MARDLTVTLHNTRASLISRCLLIFVAFVVIVDSTGITNLKDDFAEYEVYSNGNTSNWFHCPQGWTFFKDRCFKITEVALTWAQAQSLCRSYGGNLVKITSQCEQNWVSQFVREQLGNVSHSVDQNHVIPNVADVPDIDAWIGFVRLSDKTFQWSDGQAGVEQDGFWAVNGFQALHDRSVSKLCCDIKAQFSVSKILYWHLAACDELHSSVCELEPCEEHTQHCADGIGCIKKAWICDGQWDCQDGSDERDCDKNLSALSSAESQHCGSVFKGQSGAFWSPNFPEEYPQFLNCLWKIEATPPQVIEILVHSLEIEEKYDFLNIYESTDISEKQLIVSLGGRMYNQTIKSQGSFVTVYFASDHSVQGKGFNITWKAEPETKQCGGQLIARNQESLLSFPEAEHDKSEWSSLKVLSCDWVISSQSTTDLLTLQFKNITLVSGDSITVYDGSGTDAPVITHITSAIGALIPSAKPDFSEAAYTDSFNIPPAITSSGQHLLLHVIISRGSLSNFVAAYKNGCDAIISSYSSLILSPGYQKSLYPNNLNCTWTMSRDRLGRHLTLLILPHFLTEFGKDYVQVFRYENELQMTNVTKISGFTSSFQPSMSSSHGFLITFVSDSTINHGRWAAVISYDCVVLSVLPPLLLNMTNNLFGATVEYSCVRGYKLVGPTHAVCGWNGLWIPSKLPICTKISCSIIPVPSGAYLINVTGLTYGSYAHYQCLHGYRLEGHSEATCGDHDWENVPSCKLITCPKERPPLGGNARAEDIRVGYLREFFCKPKLQLIGSKFSHCNISGQWTAKVPVCEARKCSNLYGPLNGQRNITGPLAIGRSIQVICDKGYKLIGQAELTCMDDLQFSDSLPSCVDIDECDNSDICGEHVCQNFIGGYNCFCNRGYQHLDNSTHICVDINECDANNGGCSHMCINLPGNYKCDCPYNMSLYLGLLDQIGSLILIPNKTCIASCKPIVMEEYVKVMYQHQPLSNDEFLYGTKAYIVCPSNLYPNGTSVMSCMAGEGWSPMITGCTALFCEAPSFINNGTISYKSITLGSSVSYSCDKNLILQGPKIRVCVKHLNRDLQIVKLGWTGSEPRCVAVTCPELSSPAHGTVDCSSSVYNSVAVFRCQCGYQLVGQSVVKCLSDGYWSHPSPTCQALSCFHPGLPSHATMLEYSPGFPVQSLVKFKCFDKGYRLSGQDAIKCLGYKEAKVSIIKPSIDLAISGQLMPLDLVILTRDCISMYKAEESFEKCVRKMVQLCQVFSVVVDVQKDTSSMLSASFHNFTVHFLLSSDNTSAICQCRHEILSYLMASLNHVTFANLDNSCPTVSFKLNALPVVNDHWFCSPGLRLEGGKQQPCGQDILPSCMEDCIDDGIETLDSKTLSEITTPAKSDRDNENQSSFWTYASTLTTSITETTENSLKVTQQTTQSEIAGSSTLPNIQSTTDDKDKITSKQLFSIVTTADPSSITGTSPRIPLLHSKETTRNIRTSPPGNTVQQTGSSTTVKPSLKTPSDSTAYSGLLQSRDTTAHVMTTPNKNTVNNIVSSTKQSSSTLITLESTSTTASNYVATEQTVRPSSIPSPTPISSSPTTLISSSPTRSVLPNTTFPRSERSSMIPASSTTSYEGGQNTDYFGTSFPLSETSKTNPTGTEVFLQTTRFPGSSSINCTTYTDHENQHFNTSQETNSSYSERGGHFREESNTTDCFTTHAIEKQKVTFVHGTSEPTGDMSTPVYSVEIYDYILGSFENISCLDAVHTHINAKVNELLREFANQMGRLVCKDAPDVSLELTSGNIRFKSTGAKIFIKFSITYQTSSKASVVYCGTEFQSYAASHLPMKFDKTESEASVCKSVNYTEQGFNITYHGWRCHSGYLLDNNTFQCFHSSLRQSVTISMQSSSLLPVLTVPRLSLIFVGTFTSSNSEDIVDEKCTKEYKIAFTKVLTALEQNIQSVIFKDIYVHIEQDINVTLSNRKVIVEVAVTLKPLQESVDSISMYKCANFTSLQLREPSQQILSVSVSKMHLATCPVLVLSAHGLRADISKIQLYCPLGYLINEANFKCINENLPLYSSSIEIAMMGTYEELACENIIKSSVQKLRVDVFTEIHHSLSVGSICNTTKGVIFLQESEVLSLGKQGINISIPVTLVNLHGGKSETIDCAIQLYKYLRSSLAQPVSSLINTVSHTCGARMTFSQNYTVPSKRWICSQQRIYNPFTHKCDFVTTQVPLTQTAEQIIPNRHKRSVVNFQLRPQWNTTLPTCIDVEPPMFESCPDRSVVITIGQLGPVTILNLLPNVTDNSGQKPRITFTPDIRLPYRFTNDTTVVMVAKDEAGNIATCTINVTINDQILPSITCPTHLVRIVTKTLEENPQIFYNNTGVTATDNSGVVSIVYDPPEGTEVKATEVILVTASAVDGSFNVANCSFFARMESEECPEWSLPNPDGGNKSCEFIRSNDKGLICGLSCPADRGFAVQPPEKYTCISSGQWLPHKRVPQCVESRFPDFEIRLSFQLPYQGNTTGECLKEMLNALIGSVRPRLLSACWNATQELDFTHIDSVGTFFKDSLTMMTAKLKISIKLADRDLAVTATAQWCGETLLSSLEFNGTLQGSCGQIQLKAPVASDRKNSCPGGFAPVSGMCYECPAGSYLSSPMCKECPKESYQNTSGIVSCMELGFDCPQGQYSTDPKCLDCPVGTFQNITGSSKCLACKSGYSTLDVGAKNEGECIAKGIGKTKCGENHFSLTGLQPCIPCPLGTYQPMSGSKFCIVCEFDNDGRSQSTYCKKLCAPGEYSSDGANPCKVCPLNYFSQYIGSTTCTECPDNRVTKIMGSTSQAQCEAHDPCLEQPCKYGSQCKSQGRDFKCECLSGFTGPTCQDNEEIYDNQLCENNTKCENCSTGVKHSRPPGLVNVTCAHEVSVIDHCLSNPCVYGSCVNMSSGFSCSCYSGFHGERCDIKIDNCAEVICYNGGVCVDLVVAFQCSCAEGFTGNYCHIKIDHCQQNYCLNGGTCVDDNKSFSCICPNGLMGDLCQVNIDECTSSPCLNGGLCHDGINSFKCLCDPEYTGSLCEFVVDPCEVMPCLNRATCLHTQETDSGFYCECEEGYIGERCQEEIDFCQRMPCNINGSFSCENYDSDFKCNCLPGWTGDLCDVKMDPCSSQPCHNGAKCDNSSDTFVCACPSLFAGPTCSISINSCQSSPCQNLGSCVEKNSSFLCQCLPGFTGIICEVNIDECESSVCLNNGTCEDGINAFSCRCQEGFAGGLCEVNIDECLSHPCQHNSSCKQLDGDYMCNCSAGFTGKDCDIEYDECSSHPCQHNGRCVEQVASFYCECPEGYSGALCTEAMDKCQDNIICLNNATCQQVNGTFVCHCTPYFTGPDCGKDIDRTTLTCAEWSQKIWAETSYPHVSDSSIREKSVNFDLYFIGDHSLHSHLPVMHLHNGNLSELSLCLWVKFRHPDSGGTYLVLTSEDEFSNFLTLNNSHAASLLFASKAVTLYTNDGQWHHLCFLLSTSHWKIFKDGQLFQQGVMQKWMLENSLKMKLGQPRDNRENNEWFRGYLHGVNMYSFSLDLEDILNMSQSCVYKKQGNLFDWVTVDSQLSGDVQVRMPSQCGQPLCSVGGDTSLCSPSVDVDKTSPEVVSCPGTSVVTNKMDLVPVTWTEPEFSDNIGIVSVKQNFRSGNGCWSYGQIFPHGQYLVTYIAYDAQNNAAKCSFMIIVRKFNCVDPPPPINGACICRDWEHGRYCIPSCNPNFHFVTPIPPLYRCGLEGIWDSLGGVQFSFPMCVRTYPADHTINGYIKFDGPKCTSPFKLKLQYKLKYILRQLDIAVTLCKDDHVCNFTGGLDIKCDLDTNRVRRAVSSGRSVYTVAMNISLSSSLSDKLVDPDSVRDEVVYLIKHNQTDSDFFLASVDLHLSSHCQSGQMLISGDKPQCLDCPAGYFMTNKSVCSPCPRGWFSDKPLQTFCTQCADGLTTSSEGATSALQCSDICKTGTYFKVSTSSCEPCPVGEYQNFPGQWSCKPCPVGLTTQFSASKAVNDCQDLCGAGQELGVNGTCVDCPLGTYSTGKDTSSLCITCPYGWTTEKKMAVDQTQCSIKKCEKGYYHDPKNKICQPCPLGTFQESRGAAACEPCGVRLTTNHEGADSRLLCRPGIVNECELHVDSCGPGTQCVDQDDGYTCECKHGKMVTGRCVDNCQNYCSNLRSCNEAGATQDKECHCAVQMCNDENSRDSMYKMLVTASIIVTVFAVLVLVVVIIVCVYRRNQQMKQYKHIRMYRDETELASFTNEGFDSTHVDLHRNEGFLQMPTKMATRLHNQSFVSVGPLPGSEIETGDL